MKFLFIFTFLIFVSNSVNSRNLGETEITTEGGIEVYQDEKYYLLKENVKIESDNFSLTGEEVKIFFNKDLYDVELIDAFKNVFLVSKEQNLNAKGQSLQFKVKEELLNIKGEFSEFKTSQIVMLSDGNIKVNNITGEFFIIGKNSSLKGDDIFIKGENIEGIFSSDTQNNDILYLKVKDDNISYVKTKNTEMFAKIIDYKKDTSLIELEQNVKIIRDGETITGDYGTLDTATNSFKVKSKETKKVKIIILNQDE